MTKSPIRRLAAALTLSAVLVMSSAAVTASPTVVSSSGATLAANHILVSPDVHHDISLVLRDLPIKPLADTGKVQQKPASIHPQPSLARRPLVTDPLVQTKAGLDSMPPVTVNFLALIYQFTSPPDMVAAVGSSQFVEMTNASFQEAYQVWDKNGISLYGPVTVGGIWAGFGGSCELNDTTYPIVLYDQLAHRWLLTDLSQGGGTLYECIAVSTADDATGSWYRYAFAVGAGSLPDYPQFGVWPDGYYMTARVGSGVRPFVFDRAHMLSGQAASFQTTASPVAGYSFLMPASLDGATLPPTAAPNYEVALNSGNPNFTMFKFHVDWGNPANTSFTSYGSLTPASYNPLCGGSVCVPQPGTGIQLDSQGDHPMMRGAYRNFGDHEAMVFTFSVDAGGGRGGVRWYELRGLATSPTIYQQGTFAPSDGNYRWMGSAAMDHVGNLAMGYSVSSSSTYPSIDYAGRLADDPLGQLAQGEGSIYSGTHSLNTSDWGRYADITVDPSDDCTFYHVNQFAFESGQWTGYWATRVGAFKFANCNLNPTPTATVGVATVTPTTPPASPTNTPLPPTNTPLPTQTPGGSTATPVPPTNTATPAPPTPTSTLSSTNTPTNTPLPTQTAGGPTPTDCANVFTDIGGNIFYTAIHYLNCRGVVNGTDASHYSPAGTSTRGQFAKVVVLGFGVPSYTPPGQPDFSDVPSSYFAYLYIESGFHAGILSGYDAATCQANGQTSPCYLPNRAITRGQLTKLVVGAAHYPFYTPTGGQPSFTDVPSTNVFFVSIETAHYKGVINGYPDGTFRPNNPIRRDEMAQIVYKGLTTP